MNPKLRYDWVPDGLKSFTQGWMGTTIICLIACLAIVAVWWAAGKLSNNFYIRQNRAGLVMVCLLAAGSIIASLPAGLQWGSSLNPVPGGIAVYSGASSGIHVDPVLSAAIGADAATSVAKGRQKQQQAKNHLNAAKNDAGNAWNHLTSGHPVQAGGSALHAAGNALHGEADAVGGFFDDAKAGFQYVQHHGFVNTVKDGVHAIGKEVSGWFHH